MSSQFPVKGATRFRKLAGDASQDRLCEIIQYQIQADRRADQMRFLPVKPNKKEQDSNSIVEHETDSDL